MGNRFLVGFFEAQNIADMGVNPDQSAKSIRVVLEFRTLQDFLGLVVSLKSLIVAEETFGAFRRPESGNRQPFLQNHCVRSGKPGRPGQCNRGDGRP